MDKRTEEKSFWQAKLKPLRRVGAVTLAATIALSVPAVSNVVSEVSPFNNLQVSVAHAETDNMMDSQDTTKFHINYNEEYEHWRHSLDNSGDMLVDGPEFDLTDLKYVVKLPDELGHLLDNDYVTDYLLGNVTNFDAAVNPFMITGNVIDADGERITIVKDEHKPYNYISFNKETNSIEFDFDSFYTDNNLEPDIRQRVNGEFRFNTLGFDTPIIVPDSSKLYNGTYEFKTAIVRGNSVDLDNVANAYSENLVVDYSEDGEYPDPEPEEPEVDTSALESLVEEAKNYDAADYTEDSFEALASALSESEAVLGNDEAAQEEVDAALEALQAAINGLVDAEEPSEPEEPEEVNTEALEALIEEATNYDEADYTDESFEALAAALTGAEAALEDGDATQDELDAALAALQNAIEGLDPINGEEPTDPEAPVDVDTEALENSVEEANGLHAEDYTEESFADLTAALTEAEAVLETDGATQEQVDAALIALNIALDELEGIVEPDPEPEPEDPVVVTEALEALIEKANGHSAEDYTEASFAALTSAVSAAEEIIEDANATEEDVATALKAIETALDNLVPAKSGEDPGDEEKEVDTTDLTALVEKANKFDGKDYTDDSFGALTSALENAEKVLGNDEVTQEEVDEALAELQAAIDDLVKVKKIEIEEKKTEEAAGTTVEKGDGDRLPDTATNTYSLLLLGGLLTIAGGAILFIRRKKFV